MDWSEFYQTRVNDSSYDAYFENKYKYFLEAIADASFHSKSIVELGSGIGTVYKLLNKKYFINTEAVPRPYLMIDNNSKMHELALLNLSKNCSKRVLLLNMDIINPELTTLFKALSNSVLYSFPLLVSHGVLEHFQDKEIISILNAYKGPQIHYVPSYKYQSPSFGSERLLSVQDWREILCPLNMYSLKIEYFNHNYDILITLNL